MARFVRDVESMIEWGEMRAAWMAGSSPAMTNPVALRTDPMRYAVVIEKGERNDSAYVPDLPGCVSVGNAAGRSEGGNPRGDRISSRRHAGGWVADPKAVEPGELCRGWRTGCISQSQASRHGRA